MTIIRRIQKRRDTAANWIAANPVLLAGEVGRETDTRKEKTGDGVSAWNSLNYDNLGLGTLAAQSALLDTNRRELEKLSRIRATKLKSKLASIKNNGTGTASIAIFGDSIARSFFPDLLAKQIWDEYGFRGACALSVSMNGGTWSNVTGGATVVNNEYLSSPNTTVTRLAGASQAVFFSAPAGTTFSINKATVVYRRKSGGGTFKLQFATSRAATSISALWTDIATYDTNNVANDLVAVTYTWAAASNDNLIRCVHVSGGQCDIVACMVENTANAGVIVSYLDAGGIDMSDTNTMPQANLTTLLNVLAPDLITWSMKDANNQSGDTVTAKLTAHNALWQAAFATDWLYITPYPDAVAASISQARIQADPVIAHAIAVGQSYFDTLDFIESYAYGTANGFFADPTHVNSLANTTFGQQLLDAIGILPRSSFRSPYGPGGTAYFDSVFLDGVTVTERIGRIRSAVESKSSGLTFNAGDGRVINNVSMATTLSSGITMLCFTRVPDSQGSDQEIFRTTTTDFGAADGQVALVIRNGNIRLSWRNGGTTYTDDSVSLWNAWRTFAGQIVCIGVRYNPSAAASDSPFSFFLNGVKTSSVVSNDRTGVLSGDYFQLASHLNANAVTWTVYRALCYHSALTDSEIATIAVNGIGSTTPKIDWRFTEGSGSAVMDHGGNGWDARIRAGFWIHRKRTVGHPRVIATDNPHVTVVGDNLITDTAARMLVPLPSSPQVGDELQLLGKGSGGWRITQLAGHQIFEGAGGTVGTNATTAGASGTLSSTQRYDGILLRCVAAVPATPLYQWVVDKRNGALTWV